VPLSINRRSSVEPSLRTEFDDEEADEEVDETEDENPSEDTAVLSPNPKSQSFSVKSSSVISPNDITIEMRAR